MNSTQPKEMVGPWQALTGRGLSSGERQPWVSIAATKNPLSVFTAPGQQEEVEN